MRTGRGRKGAIQNEELLLEALDGGTFFVPCLDKKDAHSKAVSLQNAKNSRLSPSRQKKIRIQEVEIAGVWGVKVFPAADVVVYRIVDEKMVRWNPEEEQEKEVATGIDGKLPADMKRMIKLMTKDKLPEAEILSKFPPTTHELVKAEIALWAGVQVC